MRVPVRKHGKPTGFTLVEMAIVLVIIGIILAGVMKGRDIVRGSQIKQFSQQFAQKWVTVAQTYYDKTGQVLNDGEPNGGVAAGVPDGQMDGATGSTAAISANTLNRLQGVGINICTIVKSRLTSAVAGGLNVIADSEVCTDGTDDLVNPWQSLVDGEYISGSLVEVDLISVVLTVNNIAQNRNMLVIYNVPTDVAQGLDTAIDGTSNGVAGTCVGMGDAYDADAAAGNAAELAVGDDVTATAWAAAATPGDVPQAQTVGIIMDF